MMKKLKFYIDLKTMFTCKIFLFALLIGMHSSCSIEEQIIEDSPMSTRSEYKVLNGTDLKNLPELYAKIISLESKKIEQDVQLLEVKKCNYLKIKKDKFSVIENKNSKTYTFFVENDCDKEVVENLVIYQEKNSTKNINIFEYTLKTNYKASKNSEIRKENIKKLSTYDITENQTTLSRSASAPIHMDSDGNCFYLDNARWPDGKLVMTVNYVPCPQGTGPTSGGSSGGSAPIPVEIYYVTPDVMTGMTTTIIYLLPYGGAPGTPIPLPAGTNTAFIEQLLELRPQLYVENLTEVNKFWTANLPTYNYLQNSSNQFIMDYITNYLTTTNNNLPYFLYNTESLEFCQEMIDFLKSENYSQDAIEQTQKTIELISTGKINGNHVIETPDEPITDMREYLSCFNLSQPATITIYADQPVANNHWLYSPSNRVGHAFISIKQGTKVKSFGFYPKIAESCVIPNVATAKPNDFLTTLGIFHNDENHPFDVSLSMPASPGDLGMIIRHTIMIAESSPGYNLGTINCTDRAIEIFHNRETPIRIPDCESPGPWAGQTPGTLGQVIRNLTIPARTGGIKNTSGGIAPTNNSN